MPTVMRTAGRLALTLMVVALLGAMLSPPAEAHRGVLADVLDTPAAPAPLAVAAEEPTRFVGAAAPAAPLPVWPLVAALVALGLAGASKPRRALALVLVVVVAIFALETGVHSVHHLTDVDRGESCAVASASQHISGTEVDLSLVDVSLPAARQAAAIGAFIERSRIIGPAQGRAPPALPA
jgi:hypothetical protein